MTSLVNLCKHRPHTSGRTTGLSHANFLLFPSTYFIRFLDFCLERSESRGIHSAHRYRPVDYFICGQGFDCPRPARPSTMRFLIILFVAGSFALTVPPAGFGTPIIALPSQPSGSNVSPWQHPLKGSDPREISSGPGAFETDHFGHRGVDFPAKPGTPVHSVGAGVVYFTGLIAGKPTISINHGLHPRLAPLPIRSTYEPVVSTLTRGDYVHAGQVIGHMAVGNSHCSGTCLHLGLKIDKHRYIDPNLLWPYWSWLVSSARG